MRKEIIVAIIAGIGVGLIIAFGVWRTNSAISTNISQVLQRQESKEQTTDSGLTLTSPVNYQVVGEVSIEVAGATNPNATVVVSTKDDNHVIQADENGSFTQNTDLVTGINQILVTSFNQTGEKSQELITVVYSEAFFASLENDEVVSESTDSADLLRQKVQEKLNLIASSPTSFVGTITDKQENTLQLSAHAFGSADQNANNIQQVMIEEQTVFIGTNDDEVDYGDIAIGDFVIAMGYITNGNEVLEAKRIVVTSPPVALSTSVNMGQLSEVASKKATLTTPTESLEIAFGARWVGPEISEFEESETVLVITQLTTDTNQVVLIEKLTDL